MKSNQNKIYLENIVTVTHTLTDTINEYLYSNVLILVGGKVPNFAMYLGNSSTFGEFQVHGIDLFQDFFGLVHANSSLLCERSQSVPLITNSLAPKKFKK